ncbi:hypothetical protein RCP98_002672, partial [Pseudomonas aeruginosa]|nr:hypothetical protein [Pseudomonas aeruginosa]ELJ2278904.1 hypothetical protein [Pseudomonas aeruginosa]
AIGRGNQFVKHPALAAVPPKPPLDSVIAITRVSKYLNVALIPNASIFTLDLFVASLSDFASVGLLQSNIFSAWAWSRGGRMKHDLRFSGSDVLETFPMPVSYRCPEMEMLGEEFHHVRAALMREKGLGLTKITNLVHSPKVQGAQIDRLREAWSQIDAHVIGLYGWSDIQLNHGFHEVDYRPESDRVRFTISEAARVEVLLRLSELNRQRYEEELAQVLHGEAKPRTSSRAPRTRRIPNAATFQSSLDFDANPANEGRYLKVAEPPADYRAGPVRAIVEYLSTHPGWHAKASILAVTGITDGQWNVAIADLISRGRVERHGERRGTRYQLIE